MPYALLSLSDKSDLVPFAKSLKKYGFTLLSSGGTHRALTDAGVEATDVSHYTGFESIMGGRVKTLHPKVHGGILGRRGQDDEVMQAHGIEAIDLVCVNLYPFKQTISKPDCTYADAVENIDIGGPAMIRAAAKNHQWVTVVTSPTDYDRVIQALEQDGEINVSLRQQLAQKAFAHTANYDQWIQHYLAKHIEHSDEVAPLPETLHITAEKILDLRYGENAHQRAAFYRNMNSPKGTIATSELLQGKPLSYNNIADADTALNCVNEYQQAGCVIVKHANPCGAAIGNNLLEAYKKAYATDPTAAFGGIIAFNRPLDQATAAQIMSQQFVEVIVAPSVEASALEHLASKPNVRVLVTHGKPEFNQPLNIKSISGGFLVQDEDQLLQAPTLTVVSERHPTDQELKDLQFSWHLVKYVKSNAIVFAKNQASAGIGAGQMSRVFAAQIAVEKAKIEGIDLAGSVVASDAFFPFRDGVDIIAATGATAIIQPGGSMRDEEVIQAANEAGIAMMFTGQRHFRH